MAAKRARNSKGHYVKDDPSTPDVNEAYEQEPSKKAKQAKAKKTDAPDFSWFVSANPENAAYDVRLGDDMRIRGIWDTDRAYVTWKVPSRLTEAMKKHHHVWSGRIIPVEDD